MLDGGQEHDSCIFTKMRRVRVGSKTAYTSVDPHVRVGHYLCHTLQAHHIMEEFQESTFQAHPLVAPSIVMPLFEHRASRAEVETLQTLVSTQTKTLAEQAKELKVFKGQDGRNGNPVGCDQEEIG
jgi:hypothetical protein